MNSTRKSLFAILFSAILSMSVAFGLAGCSTPDGDGDGLHSRNVYIINYGYNTILESNISYLDPITCELGDVLTLPEFPNVNGLTFSGWMLDKSPEPLQPGQEFEVTADMFYVGGTYFDGEVNVLEYYCEISGQCEPKYHTATIHFNSTETDSLEYCMAIYDDFSYGLDSSLCRWAQIPDGNAIMGDFEQQEGYDSQLVGNIYVDDYVFDGWYFDEDFETPYDNDVLNSAVLGDTDIYAKWKFTGMTFEYSSTDPYADGYYTWTSLSTTAPISELVIPTQIHGKYVTHMQDNIYEGTYQITKLVLPEKLSCVPTNAFTNELISEVVVSSWTGFEKRAFNGSNATVTIPSESLYFYENGILYLMSVSDDGYGNDKPIIYSVSSDLSGDVVLPWGVVSLDGFFVGTDIRSIVLPRTMKQIPAGEFSNCTSLEKVVIKSDTYNTLNPGISRIKEDAFEGCTSLKTLILGASIDVIETNAFAPATVEVYYHGSSAGWQSIQNGDTGLNATVYYYSASEQPIENYLSTGEICWYYSEDDEPTLWINIADTLDGKTFRISSAEATVSQYYWSMIEGVKQHNMLDQVFDPVENADFYNAALNASTKSEFEANMSAIYSTQYAEASFSNGVLTMSNQNATNVPYNYLEINNQIYVQGVGAVLYVESDTCIYELVKGAQISGNDTINVKYNYTLVD